MQASAWRSPLVILLAGAAILALNMGLRQTYGLFLEPMTSDLGVTRTSFSLAIAIQNLLWGIVTPIFGVLADRYGTARCLIAGGLFYVGGLLVMAVGEGALGVHLGGGLLTGLAVSASGFPLVLAAVARAFGPAHRSVALGCASAGGSVGQFILLPVSQVLINDMGWQGALVVLAGLSFLIVPLAAALAGRPLADTGEGPESTLLGAVRGAMRHQGYLLLTAGFFVCGFHVSFVATHLPGYVVSCNLDAIVGATSLGIIGFFNIIGGLLAGVLGGKLRKKYVLSGIYIGRSLAIAFLLLAPKTELTLWIFSGVFGLLWLSTVPLTSGLVGDMFGPRFMATLFGGVMLGHQIGAFFGAWLGGISFDLTNGYEPVWIVSMALGIMAAALHWPISERPAEATVGAR